MLPNLSHMMWAALTHGWIARSVYDGEWVLPPRHSNLALHVLTKGMAYTIPLAFSSMEGYKWSNSSNQAATCSIQEKETPYYVRL